MATFKVVAKKAHLKYTYNEKTGNYDTKAEDLVETYDNFESALSEFLYYISEDVGPTKVSLIVVPGKKSKK